MLCFAGTAASFLVTNSRIPRSHAVVVAAKGKKGKKGKKPKQQKKSGMDWARDFEVMPFDSSVLRPLADAAAGAFEARTGKPLDASLAGAGDLPKALYKAPVCVMVVAAGDDGSSISYANDAACEFAGKKHTELIGSATTLPATVADGYDSSYEKKIDGNTDYGLVVQLADYLKLPIHQVLEFSEEEFMTWLIFLQDKNKRETHEMNVAKMKAKSRR